MEFVSPLIYFRAGTIGVIEDAEVSQWWSTDKGATDGTTRVDAEYLEVVGVRN